MISYESASHVPTPQGLVIIDTIDNRDRIIDELLKRIHTKYDTIAKENAELRKTLSEISQYSIDNKTVFTSANALYNTPYTIPTNIGVVPANIPAILQNYNTEPITRLDNLGNTHIVLTEATKKGYELCKPFYSHDYEYYNKNGKNPSEQLKIFNEVHGIISKKGRAIQLPGHHARAILDTNATNKNVNLSDAIDYDDVEEVWYDYGAFNRSKKYMSALIGIVTDYMSASVYVEKLLAKLDSIVIEMNKDKGLLNEVFNGLLSDDESGEIGIIFKGGNVYKLFTQILNSQLDYSVFQNYVDDVEQFFKKSDCDFSVVLIAIKGNDKRFIHMTRTREHENTISALQFMILNRFRNYFLGGTQYEYLSMCGKNDIVMSAKMNKLMETMMTVIVNGRIEFEQKVFNILNEKIKFQKKNVGLTDEELKSYLSASATDIRSSNQNVFKLLDAIEMNPDIANSINDGSTVSYGIRNGKLIDWFKLFMAYSTRNNKLLPTSSLFVNVKLPREVIVELQRVTTDTMEWRDVKTLYDVKDITNILIGDNSYSNTSYATKKYVLNDESLFRKIIQIDPNNAPDPTARISAERMKILGRVHSNRNDFMIRFEKSKMYPLPSGELVSDTIMYTQTIPYSDGPNGQKRGFITPFYISINKEISGINEFLSTEQGEQSFLMNMNKMSVFGSSGTKKINDDSVYMRTYNRIIDSFNKKIIAGSNFSLSRLMASFTVVFVTNKSEYFSIPLAAEYIDLSYTYEGDNKSVVYESFDEYIPFNGTIANRDIDTLLTKYGELFDYVSSPQYDADLKTLPEYQNNDVLRNDYIIKMKSSIKNQTTDILNDTFINTKLTIIGSYVAANSKSDLGRTIIQSPTGINASILLKIIKYFTFYGRSSGHIKLESTHIYFPKLSTFILDLYTILFVDSNYPWTDAKYDKRLQRLLFFIFIEKLQYANSNNTYSLLEDLGIKTKRDDQDLKQNNSISAMYISTLDPDTNPTLNQMKSLITAFKYYDQYSFTRSYTYFRYRENYMYDSQNLNIEESTNSSGGNHKYNIISACGIDHFMYCYHLLDFFPIYKVNDDRPNPFFRSRFILKQKLASTSTNKKITSDYYVIVSFTENESTDMNDTNNQARNLSIFNNTPKNLDYYNTPGYDISVNNEPENKKITLSYGITVDRYQLVDPSSTDPVIKKIYEYIITCEQIRERLLITVFNYIYDNEMIQNGKKHIWQNDPTHILVNVYEGDIDKILTVV